MKNIFFTLILFILSAFFIFFRYNDVPKGLAHDEIELARVAFSLENKPYTPFTSLADGHGTPYFYILLGSFKTFGINQFALRLPNKVFGITIILIFYMMMNLVFHSHKKWREIISLTLCLIFLTSRWYLHFVRFSFEMPFLLFIELVSLYTMLLYQKNGRIVFIILSGLFAGIAFNSYQPGRIFFLVPLCVLFLYKNSWKKYVIYLIMFFIMIIPISSYLFLHPQSDIRVNQQLFIKNTSMTIGEKVAFFGSNIASTTLMFFWKGDINGRHNFPGKPAINPILFSLLLFGLIISFMRKRTKADFIFLIYFIISIAPTIMTYPWENPNMLRTYTCLPALIYFIGRGFFQIFSFAHTKKYVVPLLAFLFTAIVISSYYEMKTYFIYQPLVFKQAVFGQPDYLPIVRQSALKQSQ